MNLSQIRLYLISKNISVEKADEIINDISKEAVKEFAEKLFEMGLVGFPEEVNKLLKEYEEI
jgi:hypothetical protein